MSFQLPTNPETLPDDVKRKLLAIRDALAAEDYEEAYHQLYWIADPMCESTEPWAALEGASQTSPSGSYDGREKPNE